MAVKMRNICESGFATVAMKSKRQISLKIDNLNVARRVSLSSIKT